MSGEHESGERYSGMTGGQPTSISVLEILIRDRRSSFERLDAAVPMSRFAPPVLTKIDSSVIVKRNNFIIPKGKPSELFFRYYRFLVVGYEPGLVELKNAKKDAAERIAADQTRIISYQEQIKNLTDMFAPAAKRGAAESIMKEIGWGAPCYITKTSQITPTQRKTFVGEFGGRLGFRAGKSLESSLESRLGVAYSIFVRQFDAWNKQVHRSIDVTDKEIVRTIFLALADETDTYIYAALYNLINHGYEFAADKDDIWIYGMHKRGALGHSYLDGSIPLDIWWGDRWTTDHPDRVLPATPEEYRPGEGPSWWMR